MKETFSAALLCAVMLADARPPATKQIPVTDSYFGKTVTDNYRWLEDMNNKAVQDWFKAQSDYTNSLLDKLPGRDSLFHEYQRLDAMASAEITDITRKANRYFYKKKLPRENVGKFGIGTSAGGVLIGRAITERPDLFGAAISNVSCSNALRFENTPNGPNNTKEFGTIKDSVECMGLYEMDAFQHVKPRTPYPAVICVGGINDPRVSAWEPRKFAAALQNASTSGKAVVFDVNYDNGHFTEDKSVADRNFANMYSFALWQTGNPDFQVNGK